MDPVPGRDPAGTRGDPGSPGKEDAALVAAVVRGEPAALERFVVRLRCVPKILACLNLRAGRKLDDELLADLAQDTLIVLWRKLSEFRSFGTLESWAYGISYLEFRNACRRSARLRRQQVALVEELHPAQEPETDRDAEPDLEQALDALGGEDSAVLRLRHMENLSFDAIGLRLAMPGNTAKTRYHRALKRLREALHAKVRREEHPR